MKKYKLLKDLPFAKAGSEWEIEEKEDESLYILNEIGGAIPRQWDGYWGDPRESEWFEEVTGNDDSDSFNKAFANLKQSADDLLAAIDQFKI